MIACFFSPIPRYESVISPYLPAFVMPLLDAFIFDAFLLDSLLLITVGCCWPIPWDPEDSVSFSLISEIEITIDSPNDPSRCWFGVAVNTG